MNGQGNYLYDSQPKRYPSDGRYPINDVYQRGYLPDRPRAPAGDVYGSLDRVQDRPVAYMPDRQPGPVTGELYTAVERGRGTSSLPGGSPGPYRRPGQRTYELEHLATFTASGPVPGRVLTPPEGVRRVREMAQTGAIWPLRVQVTIGDGAIVVVDANSGAEMEFFPLSLVSEPVSATAVDRRAGSSDTLDNLVIFTVLEDPVNKTSPPEMHIFQCLERSGQEFVDDILAAKVGKPSGKIVVPESRVPAYVQPVQPRPPQTMAYDSMLAAERAALADSQYQSAPVPGEMFRKSMKQSGWEPGGLSSMLNEATQRSVTLLDRCFTDIEQFVMRIQQAANAYRELDNRRSVRVNKNMQQYGDGLLGLRSRPPPAKDFIDILQKFKLCFILLARLKANIRDPNAPELVHFLFAPLTLVINASRGGESAMPAEMASRIIAPLLTVEALELLDNCLTSKEEELLQSLGPAWNTNVDRWQGEIPPFVPRFYDGWQPPAFWMEEIGIPTGSAPVSRPPAGQYRRDGAQPLAADMPGRTAYAKGQGSESSSLSEYEMRNMELQRRLAQDFHRHRELELSRQMAKNSIPDPWPDRPQDRSGAKSPNWDRPADKSRSKSPDWDKPDSTSDMNRADVRLPQDGRARPQDAAVEQTNSKLSALPAASQDFARELKARGAKIFKVTHERESKNQKELSVKTGDIVEVLDDQKNWWKVRNSSGGAGFIPKTILEQFSF